MASKENMAAVNADHDLEKQLDEKPGASSVCSKSSQTTTPIPVAEPNAEPKDPNLVEFEGPNDTGNPKNWGVWKRVWISVMMGWMTFVTTFSSSIYSVAIEPVAEEYNIGIVPSTLGVSLFLLVSRSNYMLVNKRRSV